MSLLRRFNPYGLEDAVVDALSTGREGVVADLTHMIDTNVDTKPLQHGIVVAARGFGKSFLMRCVQSRLRGRDNIAMVLLPEEQRNVRRPHLLLEEIRRVLEQRKAADVRVRWSEEATAWANGVHALDAAITAKLGPNGLLVVALENFDQLLATVFREAEPQRLLRGWLTREAGRIMLLATATRHVDDDYAQPLFQAFTRFPLPLWTEEDCLLFFDRVRARECKEALTERERARARAVAIFTGGSPRMATVLYEVLSSGSAVNAATLLDDLVDELTDYFRNRLDALSPRAQDVVDTLLRAGEPKSQTDVAVLLGESQARVAEVFRELLLDQFLHGTPSVRSRVTLYQVTDRLLVHFYRTRYFDPEHRVSPLESIAEFLVEFFDETEKQAEVARLRADGHEREAALLSSLRRPSSLGYRTEPENAIDGRPFVRRRRRESDWYTAQTTGVCCEGLALCYRLLGGLQEPVDLEIVEAILDRLETDVSIQTNPLCRALTLKWRGEILGERSAFPAAIATLRDALGHAEAANDDWLQAQTLNYIGWSQAKLEKYEDAIATAHRALRSAEAAGDAREQAWSLRFIGWNEWKLQRYETSIDSLYDALTRAEAICDVGAQAEALHLIGRNQELLKRHEDAVATLRDALARAEVAGDFELQTRTLSDIGWNTGELGKYLDAMLVLQKALTSTKLTDETHSEIAIAMAFVALGARTAEVVIQHLPTILRTLLSSATRNPHVDPSTAIIVFDDVIALSIRSGEFASTWRTAREASDLLASRGNIAGGAAAEEIHRLTTANGRAAGYAAAAAVIETLAAEAEWPPREGLTAATLLRETVNSLARTLADTALLRDIVDLLDARLPDALTTERALIRARILDLEHPGDEAALEGVDPDIAAAVRRLRGETDPEVLFRRNAGRAQTGGGAPKARGAARKKRGRNS